METRDLKQKVTFIGATRKKTPSGTEVFDEELNSPRAKVEVVSNSTNEVASAEKANVRIRVTVRRGAYKANAKFIMYSNLKFKIVSIPIIADRDQWVTLEAQSNEV